MSRRRNNRSIGTRSGLSAFLRRPAFQLALVLFVAFLVYLIASANTGSTATLPRDLSVDEAYAAYQNGAFILDIRTQLEWDGYHTPNARLIPLDQLQARINELPQDQQILVICSSAICSQAGRDLLLTAGYNATSMTGGLNEWYAKGYPIEGAPPQ